jgi:predicted nucleic acid-binding protein
VSLSFALPVVVVDASVAIPALTGEAPWPERWLGWAQADAMLLAPPHFRTEVANGFLKGTTVARDELPAKLRAMARSGVDVADRGWAGVLRATELASKHGLTVYDAMYLQLALDIEAPLATIDRALAVAARAEGIEVID